VLDVRFHRDAPSDGPAVLVGVERGDGHDAGRGVGAGDGTAGVAAAIGEWLLLLEALLPLLLEALLLLLVLLLLGSRGAVSTARSDSSRGRRGGGGLVVGFDGAAAVAVDGDLRRCARCKRVGVDRLADGGGVAEDLEGEDDDEPFEVSFFF
jgi:hypothetical protein